MSFKFIQFVCWKFINFRFRWTHLTERLRHEQQTYKQKMRITTKQQYVYGQLK